MKISLGARSEDINRRQTMQWPKEKKAEGHTNNDLQHISQKTKDWATRTPLNTGVERRWTGRLSSPCSTCENSSAIRVAYAWVGSTFVLVRRVWRYQRGNQNPYITEEQKAQWPKERVQKDKQRSTKHTYKTKDRITRTPLKTGDELRCSER
jgi:hypothetical protein